MRLQHKLLVSSLIIGIIPALMISLYTLITSSQSLEKQAYKQLTSIRAIKQVEIENYFNERRANLSLLANSAAKNLDFSTQALASKSAHQHHEYFKHFIDSYGFYDLFIISNDGQIFYSTEREADYQTNLVDGKYSDSNLATLFKRVKSTQQYQLEDFAPYAPSNNEPAAFIAQPLITNGKMVGTIALQLSLEHINRLMQQRDGMGETGESYLVGSDLKMRSNSYLDPKGHSVQASFAGTIEKNGVDTTSVRGGIAGNAGTQSIIDYNGNPVLSAYTPLKIDNAQWVLLVEIDEAEAFAPISQLQKVMFFVLIISVIFVIVFALYLTKSVITPLGGEPKDMETIACQISKGDLTGQFIDTEHASGVYGAMAIMADNLNTIVSDISTITHELSTAADETSAISTQSITSLTQQQSAISTVSTAMNNISSTVESVASNAQQVASLTNDVELLSTKANGLVDTTISNINTLANEVTNATDVIQKVESKSQEIGTILEVIRGIADQTNLLALNAAIEAARAGEQGRGFAVVADEVRQLAQKTQESTQHIEEMIALLQQDTSDAVVVMGNSSKQAQLTIDAAAQTAAAINSSHQGMTKISSTAEQIADAAHQQSVGTHEIDQSLNEINEVAQHNTQGINNLASASEHLTQLSHQLKEITVHFTLRR